MSIILPVILFGLLVFIHEAGHFLMAKLSGVCVERFALGFGPVLLRHKWGETEYAICLLPLGGYVKMKGDDEEEEEEGAIHNSQDPRSFAAQSVWSRILIVAMGPISNLVLPIVIFTFLFLIGVPTPTSRIGSVMAGYPAEAAGLRSGDRIVSVDEKATVTWNDVLHAVKDRPNEKIVLRVDRQGQEMLFPLVPISESEPNLFGEVQNIGKIGVDLVPYRPVIGVMTPTSKAAQLGLQTGDIVVSVNGTPISYWWQFEKAFLQKPFPKQLTVERPEGEKANAMTVQLSGVSSLAALGLEEGELYIRKVQPGSIAEEKGLKANDRLLSLNGKTISSWDHFRKAIMKNTGDPMVVQVLRNGVRLSIELIPREVTHKDELTQERRKMRQLGITSCSIAGTPDTELERYLNPLKAFGHGMRETLEVSKTTVIGLGKLFAGKLSLSSLGGPISIFYLAGSSYKVGGWTSFFRMMAILSITLAILNFLPIPVLDGGHLLFFLIEALKGSPVPQKMRLMAHRAGMFVLLALMVLVFYVDINRFFLDRIKSLFQ